MTSQPDHMARALFLRSVALMDDRTLVAKFEEFIRQGMGPSYWKMECVRKEILRRMGEEGAS